MQIWKAIPLGLQLWYPRQSPTWVKWKLIVILSCWSLSQLGNISVNSLSLRTLGNILWLNWTLSDDLKFAEFLVYLVLERQCVIWRDNGSSGGTMCHLEKQCVVRRHNVSSGDTMCLLEKHVSSAETICLLERQCVCPRHTSRMFPAHKLGSRWSPDMFPVPNRIKMMRAIRWASQNCPE